MWRLVALILVLFGRQVWAADCADRCSARQDRCVTSCGGLAKCAKKCVASANACHSACGAEAAADDARADEASIEECVTEDGTPRRCSAAEKKALREQMAKFSKMFCKDSKGNLEPCPDQAKKVQKATSDLAKLCKKNKELCVEEQASEAGGEQGNR